VTDHGVVGQRVPGCRVCNRKCLTTVVKVQSLNWISNHWRSHWSRCVKPRLNLRVPLTTRTAAFSTRWRRSVVAFDNPVSTVLQPSTRYWIEHGLTSHQTHYRSYRGRLLQVIWPNQQCQSTEGSQLVFQIRLESHQHHSTMLQ